MSEKILYLFGAGATRGELIHQGKLGETLMKHLSNYVYETSKKDKGDYWKLTKDFSLDPVNQDIELIISLIELSDQPFDSILTELKDLYRCALVERVSKTGIKPAITSILLRLHKAYGKNLGRNGEDLLGILTINNDYLIEKAFCHDMTYGGLNCCVDFISKEYRMLKTIPMLLKLHGSFNWLISKGKLSISDSYENKENADFSGWVAPSVYKKQHLINSVFDKIWRKSREMLGKCDVLRVVGSSLRTEDLPLLSLIFSAQIEQTRKMGKSFNIELIDLETKAEEIIERLGFLVGFKRLSELDIFSEEIDSNKKDNPYYYWVTRKIDVLEEKNPRVAEDELINEMLP